MKTAGQLTYTPSNQESVKQKFYWIIFLLSVLMIMTRPYHFASALHLPSATLAVFFLGGFFLKTNKIFWGFFALTVSIDLASSYERGAFGDCITVSYPFLVVGYFALWQTGKWCFFSVGQTNIALSVTKNIVGLFIASSFAFFTSNASYYFISGKFPDLSWLQYSTRVAKYYFSYIQSPFLYVILGLAIYCIFSQIKLLKSEKINVK
ncbi:MAG: hypothetical protein HRT54_02470 [Colwellia sp.]|nr:hypothetical protein [Colwellia sp.]